MKTYKTQEEVNADIVDGRLIIGDDVTFKCSITISATINAGNINAWNIKAWNINALDITALDITALNINAWNINAVNINAVNINALDINAGDINAWNINAGNIEFYAVCFAYSKFVCMSCVGTRSNSKFFCLDSKVVITGGLEK